MGRFRRQQRRPETDQIGRRPGDQQSVMQPVGMVQAQRCASLAHRPIVRRRRHSRINKIGLCGVGRGHDERIQLDPVRVHTGG